jgi:hypothetical protein
VPAQNCLRSLKLLIRFGVPDGILNPCYRRERKMGVKTHVVFTRPGSLTKALKEPEETEHSVPRVLSQILSSSLTTLGTKRKDDFEPYWQDEKNWLCTVEFLPTDDPEARLFTAEERSPGNLRGTAALLRYSVSRPLLAEASELNCRH